MNPKASAALKVMASLGLLGGSAVGGGVLGYRRGATRAADAMSREFTEQNAIENQGITNSFKAFNEKENRALAQSSFMQGVQYAMQKQSSWEQENFKAGFEEEFEKLAASKLDMLKRLLAGAGGALKGTVTGAVKGAGAGAGIGAVKAIKRSAVQSGVASVLKATRGGGFNAKKSFKFADDILKNTGGKEVSFGAKVGAGAGGVIGAVKGARKGYLAQKAKESPLYKVRGFMSSMLGGKKTKQIEKWIKKNPGKSLGAGGILAGGAATAAIT